MPVSVRFLSDSLRPDPWPHWLNRLAEMPVPEEEQGIPGFRTPPGWVLHSVGAEPGLYRVVFLRAVHHRAASLGGGSGMDARGPFVAIGVSDHFADAWALARLNALAAPKNFWD